MFYAGGNPLVLFILFCSKLHKSPKKAKVIEGVFVSRRQWPPGTLTNFTNLHAAIVEK
ncbi:MAG: hypothetical protein ABI416_20580 [Ginsengibacter sp.]